MVLAVFHVVIFGAFAAVFPPSETAFAALLGAVLIAVSVIDIQRYEIPDTLSLLIACFGAFYVLTAPAIDLRENLIAGFGFSFILYFISEGYFRLRGRDGLGLGDVKLVFGFGLMAGIEGSIWILMIASLSAVATILVLAICRGVSSRDFKTSGLAFAPFLCLSFWVIFLQEQPAW